jgi:hypothetical protein
VDGDGDLDLLVGTMGKKIALYRNDGSGSFERASKSGLEAANSTTTLALAGVEGDEDLDLYVTNYKEKSVDDLFSRDERVFENTVEETGLDAERPYVLRSPFDGHYELLYADQSPNRRETGPRGRTLSERWRWNVHESRGDGRAVSDT